MNLELEGKVALVTGSGRGLGEVIAKRLAAEGAWVVVNARTEARVEQVVKEIEGKGGKALGLPGDIGKSVEATAIIDKIIDEWGKIDILVNNAGINRDGLLAKMTDQQWEDVIQTNLNANFYCIRAAVKYMRPAKYGKILNISSIVAEGNVGVSNYAASKAGLIGLTRAAALEMAPSGINVNALAPGFCDTDMFFDLNEKIQQRILSAIPMGRTGTPDEVADLVAFMVSARASYINGTTVYIDGGMTVGIM